MDLLKVAEQAFLNEKVAEFPSFRAGDTVTVTYRIKEGDTLYQISQQFGVTVAFLAKLNGINLFDQLKVGEKLRLK